MRFGWTLTALAVAVLSTACGGPESPTEATAKQTPNLTPERVEEVLIKPEVYQEGSEIQPINDADYFFRLVRDLSSQARKGEFEKTSEYEARLLERSSFGPLDPDAIYPVRQNMTEYMVYDADSEAYHPDPTSPTCANDFKFPDDRTSCWIGVSEEEPDYQTGNEMKWWLFILPSVDLPSSAFEVPKDRQGLTSRANVFLKSSCPVARDVAMASPGEISVSYLIKMNNVKAVGAPTQFFNAVGNQPGSANSLTGINADIIGMICTNKDNRVLYREMFNR